MLDKPIEIAPFVKQLDREGCRYVVIGGIAMVLHGCAHVTQDVDFAVSRDPKNLRSLAKALAPIHPRLRGAPADLPFVIDERLLKNTFNLTLETDWGDFDILGDIPGADSFEQLYGDSVVTNVEGVDVRIASVPDLIRMKKAANRPKDQNHILELQSLLKIQDQP